jgi:bidirectional [NiFe] hydrogenase diaphorase subunit
MNRPAPASVLLRLCDASGCRAAGAAPLAEALAAGLAGLAGASPLPRIKPVGCLRLCSRGPLLAIDRDGGSELYGGLTPAQVPPLLALACTPEAQTPRDRTGLAAHRLDSRHPFFALQRPLVLETCGVVDPTDLDDALAHGAYRQLQRLLATATPAQVRAEVRRSGLRGRGGAGYPTGLKWDTVALQPPGPRLVVANGDEGDPGAFMDRSILEGDPHRLIEGLAIAAFAVGARKGFIYVRAEYPLAIERLRRALAQVSERGLLGKAGADGAFAFAPELRVGAGAYVCGEETALLASIEGGRGIPRQRPPYPAQVGLVGCPTLINNVETLASLPALLRMGADAHAAIGPAACPGTKVFSVSGAVVRTGLIEVPMGTSLRTVVLTMAGGVPGGSGADGGIKAVQTGGPSGGCLPASLLDTPIDYEGLRALGSSLGSGGLVVLDHSCAMPELARHFMGFCADESCGKCVPCRAGTVQLADLLDRVVQGQATGADLERLERLAGVVQRTSLCGLGQTAPNPLFSTLRHFRAEYLERLLPEEPWPS